MKEETVFDWQDARAHKKLKQGPLGNLENTWEWPENLVPL